MKFVKTYESLFQYNTPTAKEIEKVFEEEGILDHFRKYIGTHTYDGETKPRLITFWIKTWSEENKGYHISFYGDSKELGSERNTGDLDPNTWVELEGGLIYNTLKNNFPGIERVWFSRLCLKHEYYDRVDEVC